MRATFVLHGFPPLHNAGAENMASRILKGLAGRGFEIRVVSRMGPAGSEWCEVVDFRGASEAVRWADVVLTHLNETNHAQRLASTHGKPLVHLLHNHRTLIAYGVTKAELIIPNSWWLAQATRRQLPRVPRLVVWPPAPVPTRPRGRADGAVALVNRMPAKGADLFYGLARAIPERRFIAVDGAYGRQVRPPYLGNLEVWENTADLDHLWPEVAVLAAPSHYESFGLSAIEALGHGIPVVASPTQGLRESLAGAGLFAEINNPRAWIETTRHALTHWDVFSKPARKRAVELAKVSDGQLDRLADMLPRL